MAKYLDLDGLTVYDGKLKEWIKSGVVDITSDAIRELFVTVAEGPADNEIWYTSSNGDVVTPYDTRAFGVNIISNTYENDKGVIKFDNSITSIGRDAFQRCSSLTSITIPNSVTSIGVDAFFDCLSLTSVTISNSVTNIEERAFYYCEELETITIPNSVVSIGDSAFGGCHKLASIIYEGTIEQWNSVYKYRDEYRDWLGGSIDAYYNWNETEVPATYVQCTNGQVPIDKSQIQ